MAGTEVVDTIVRALNEDAEGPRERIAEIVRTVGETAALALLAETQRIEDAGGELVKKGSRRRTPGGVFFRLAKASVDLEARRTIFRSPHKPKPKPEPEAEQKTQQQQRQPTPHKAPSPQRPGAPAPQATVVVRPRRRVVELGSIRQPEPPKPPAPAAKPQSGWGRPTPIRGAAAGVAEKVKREAERESERAPLSPPAAARVESPPAPRDPAQQIRQLLMQMPAEQARKLVGDLVEEFGPESKPVVRIASKAAEADVVEAAPDTRERVLSAVVEALSLKPRDLARVLYGDDSPAAVRRAQKTLEAQRKSR